MIPARVRIPDEWLPRLDALATALERSRPGVALARPDVLRVALAKGLEALELEFNLAAPTPGRDG